MNIKKNKKIISVALTIIMTITFQAAALKESYALSAYFLQCVIDDSTMNFRTEILYDNPGKKLGLPFGVDSMQKQIERKNGDFSSLKNVKNISSSSYENTKPSAQLLTGFGKEALLFTFPGYPGDVPADADEASGGLKNEATGTDYALASEVASTLGTSLSEMTSQVTGGLKVESFDDLIDVGEDIITALGSNSGTVSFDQYDTNGKQMYVTTKFEKLDLEDPGDDEKEYVKLSTVVKTGGIEYDKFEKTYTWKMQKGYGKGSNNDSSFITVQHLITQAFSNYTHVNIIGMNSSDMRQISTLETLITSIFVSIGSGLMGLLGLYNLQELLFNTGSRSTDSWVYGTIPSQWWANAMFFYIIFAFIALLFLGVSVVKMVLEANVQTVNPSKRVSIMEGFENVGISVFLILINVPIITAMMALNFSFVSAIQTGTGVDFAKAATFNANAGALGAVIFGFFYLGISIYYNFIYLTRQIIITFLIATSPLYITSIALSPTGKQTVSTYYKELGANIFIQAIHCVTLSLFIGSGMTTRGLERIVILMSVIAITELARSLFFGQSGTTLGKMGMGSMMGAAALGAAGISMAGAASNGIMGKEAPNTNLKNNGYTSKSSSVSGPSGVSMPETASRVNSEKRNAADTPVSFGEINAGEQMQELTDKANGINIGNSFDKLKEKGSNIAGGMKEKASSFKADPSGSMKSALKATPGAMMKGGSTAIKGGIMAGSAVATMTAAGAGIALAGTSPIAGAMLLKGAGDKMGAGAHKAGSLLQSPVDKLSSGLNKDESAFLASGRANELMGTFGNQEDFDIKNDSAASFDINENGQRQFVQEDGRSRSIVNSSTLADQGITNMTPYQNEEGDVGAIMEYDLDKMDPANRERVEYLATLSRTSSEAYSSGSDTVGENASSLMLNMGASGVDVTPSGKVKVLYNSEGLNQMGIDSFSASGQGKNKRYDITQTHGNHGKMTAVPNLNKNQLTGDYRYTTANNFRKSEHNKHRDNLVKK